MSLAAVRSPPPINTREATPAGTAENPKTKRTRDPKTGEMVPLPLRPLRSFDLVAGLGSRYKKLDWKHDGEEVYKYLKRVEREDLIKDIKQIFSNLLGENPAPTDDDIAKFGSFIGLLQLMKERISPQQNVKTYEEMVERFFGERGQQLSATDPEEDRSVKEKILEVFQQMLPETASSTIDVASMKSKFYSGYKIRGQTGFVEDTDQPAVDESKRRSLNKILESIIWGA